LVRLRARVGLDVRGVGAEELLRPVDRELLGDVDELAAAVIALARQAFGVLVRELRALSCEHVGARVVLRADQLDVVFLSPEFLLNRGPELGIGLAEVTPRGEHGASRICEAKILPRRFSAASAPPRSAPAPPPKLRPGRARPHPSRRRAP